MIASLVGIGLAAATPVQEGERIELAQLSFRSRVIIRIQSDTPQLEIVEKKGPKCVPLASLAGAAIVTGNAVDFILRGGQRMRARFSSGCPALDYYSGFYIVPNPDGQVCADRDVIRSRAGGECAIDRMRSLTLRPKH